MADPEDDGIITCSTPVYLGTRTLCHLWLLVVHRLRVAGRENVPRSGGALIVANHQSFLDIPIVAASAGRHVCFVARETLTRSRILAFQLRHAGAVLIRRGTADRQALKEMLIHLERGDLVAVFPEGTRSRDGSLGEFKAGAVFAAKRAGVPIVPARIDGAFEALPTGRSVPRPHPIRIRYAAPIDAARKDAMGLARDAILAMGRDGRAASG